MRAGGIHLCALASAVRLERSIGVPQSGFMGASLHRWAQEGAREVRRGTG